ncbi:hypothetical protein GVN20_23925, partial [Runella sp. CRIBMP]|uniref:SdrD B-like domain-containing protein n=1 Tax=Runella sp. CRIBMP TaxID=2683261 RepID=UPI00272A2948
MAIPSAGAWLWGITADDAGNMYVVAEDPWFNHQDTDFTGYTWILKYDPAGNLIASTSQKQTTTPKTGFKGGRGIVYYAPLNILYIAAGPDGDCIAKINPSDLSYAGAAAANIPGQNPKTIRIATEACPVLASTSVDTTLCNVKVGDRLFLSQLIGKCNAPICGGTWAADPSNAGMTFNPCDLSFTVTGLTGCGKFTLTNVGGTCGDFTIEARISFVDIKAPVIAGTQTVCSNIDPAAFTVATPAASSGTLSYQWQKSTTSCTTGFSNILGANNDTYDPPKTTQTTYYRVVASSMGGCNPPPKTCSDTSNCVTVTVLPLPVAGDDQTPTCVGNIAITTATLAATAVSGGAWTQAPGNPPGATITTVSSATSGVTGLMPGVYQFIWATSASCSDTVKITIPNCACTKPLAKVNNQSLCEGDTPKAFTATPSTGVTYAWYGPLNDTTSTLGSAISGQTAATYTPNGTFAVGKIYYAVVVTDAADATCKDTAFAAITVLAKPAAIMFCPGESYTITAEPGTTNIKWYKDGLLIADSTRSSLVVKTIGSYTYSGIKPSGDLCPDTLCCPIVFLPCGSLGDYVWKDSNNDGIQNETGTGVKDVILELYKNGIATGIKDTTGIDGKYLFAISDSASYQVKIISALPTGCVISSMQNAAAGTEATDSDFNPSTGMSDAVTVNPLNPAKKDVLTVDAALYSPKGSIGDYVWKDADNDGVQDATEAPVAGVIVQLLQGTTVVATDTTDASGLYLFSNLSSDSYQVKILTASLPAGCVISTQKDLGGDDTKDSDIDPTTGLSLVIVIDALGTGIAKDNLTVDAALNSPKGSIGDYVWKDADNDGVQDATEAPVAGVIVQLLQGTTVVATDTTDASGLYLFSNLSSGSYQVKILTASLPAGCTISTQKDLGGDDTKDSDIDPTTGLSPVIVIDALGTGIAKDNMTVDAALYSPKGSIGDYVWKDADNDGVQDATEAPVAGVIVQLLQGTTVVATDTTDASGL